jgi:hypothetical protein
MDRVIINKMPIFEIKYNKQAEVNLPKFAEGIAKRITGKHNQDFRIIVTGAFGKGKSTFCLYLGYRVAEEVAKIKGGKWQDYFNRENIAIADEEEIERIFQNLKKYSVYLLDDVGRAWGAREFMSKLNKLFNNIFQLMRTANTCLLISIASTFLVDKVPRTLSNVLVEMDVSFFDYGASLVKIKKVRHRPQYGDILYPFYNFGTFKFVRHIAMLPPAELMDDYVKERERVEIKFRTKKEDKNQPVRGEKETAKTIKAQIEEMIDDLLPLEEIYENLPDVDRDYINRVHRAKKKRDSMRRRTPLDTLPIAV